MVIHSASDPRPRTTLCGDYFYNYFSRGLDILFDGQVLMLQKGLLFFSLIHTSKLIVVVIDFQFSTIPLFVSWFLTMQTHRIKKFVLHTNFPGHPDFNTYMKCNFVIYGNDGKHFCPLPSDVVFLTFKNILHVFSL